MPLKIYKIEGSASAPVRAVLMTAEALKLKYVTQDVNIMAGENRTPEYLDKNPAHTVPMIEDDDFVLADSHAIIAYLVSKYGDGEQSKLYPSDLRTRATVNQRMFFEATILTTAAKPTILGVIHSGQTGATAQQIEDINASYEILERYLQKTKYVACDHVTIADITCAAGITSTSTFVPIDDKFPKIKAWLNTLQEEDWYKKGNLPGLAVFKAYMEDKMKKAKVLS